MRGQVRVVQDLQAEVRRVGAVIERAADVVGVLDRGLGRVVRDASLLISVKNASSVELTAPAVAAVATAASPKAPATSAVPANL